MCIACIHPSPMQCCSIATVRRRPSLATRSTGLPLRSGRRPPPPGLGWPVLSPLGRAGPGLLPWARLRRAGGTECSMLSSMYAWCCTQSVAGSAAALHYRHHAYTHSHISAVVLQHTCIAGMVLSSIDAIMATCECGCCSTV